MSATRFPISTSSPPSGSPATRYRPQSLEVPGGLPVAHLNEQLQQHYTQEAALAANAAITVDTAVGMTSEPEQIHDGGSEAGGLQRGPSLGRSGHASGGSRFKKPGGGLARTAAANQAASKRDSMSSDIGAVEGYPGYYGPSSGSASSSPVSGGTRGVQLSDRPMDD